MGSDDEGRTVRPQGAGTQIPAIADEAGRRPGEVHLSFRDATGTDANRQVLEPYSLVAARMRTRLIHPLIDTNRNAV
jgi:hypothetical protein